MTSDRVAADLTLCHQLVDILEAFSSEGLHYAELIGCLCTLGVSFDYPQLRRCLRVLQLSYLIHDGRQMIGRQEDGHWRPMNYYRSPIAQRGMWLYVADALRYYVYCPLENSTP